MPLEPGGSLVAGYISETVACGGNFIAIQRLLSTYNRVVNCKLDELRKRIADMSAFLQEQPIANTEYDEQLIRRLIEKVTYFFLTGIQISL